MKRRRFFWTVAVWRTSKAAPTLEPQPVYYYDESDLIDLKRHYASVCAGVKRKCFRFHGKGLTP